MTCMSIDVLVKLAHPKLYFERKLDGYRSPYSDPLEYCSFLDAGITDAMYAQILSEIARDQTIADPIERGRAEMQLLISHAEHAYNPEYWWIASLDGEPVGLVFPQLIHDLPGAGTVYHIGVLTEHRGKGFGRIMHARALEAMSVLGATRYIGSTQLDNLPMQHVFRANDCEFKCLRICEEFANGGGRALD